MSLEEQYLKRKNSYEKLFKKQTQTINFVSLLRLIIFISAIGFSVFFYLVKRYYISFTLFTALIYLFIILINRHSKLVYSRKCCFTMCKINENALKRLNGEWKSFDDTGEEFVQDNHNFSKDLDIFGKGSLFQYFNTANTYLGRRKLKIILTSLNYSIEEIYDRQEAVRELSVNLGWRQRFMAEGKIAAGQMGNPDPLLNWGKESSKLFNYFLFVPISRILPVITIGIIVWYFIIRNIPYYLPLLFIGIQILILKFNSKEIDKILNSVYKYKKDIEVYNRMIYLVEKKKFKSKYLKELHRNLMSEKRISVTQQITKLAKLTSLISDRQNFFYFMINSIILWDFQCIIELERWKKESGNLLKQWLDTIAELETLSSLSVLKYDNPQWTMPRFQNSSLILKAKNIGHPLLTKNRVCNDLDIGINKSIILITGSNMSGKSTLLRTAGINLVLAYAGAPVCAESFCCSIMNIYTCMRISDNLEENISSFYAEILRIKELMNAVNKKEPVFFLLDEIFRGTNSKDRHTGAKVLIEKLSKENTLGFVSTHDLELGDIEKTNIKVKNYHFREYYKDNRINFDYKLRSGISTTRNALYLMRMAGIEIEEKS